MTDYEEFKKSKQLLFAKKVVQSPQCFNLGSVCSWCAVDGVNDKHCTKLFV